MTTKKKTNTRAKKAPQRKTGTKKKAQAKKAASGRARKASGRAKKDTQGKTASMVTASDWDGLTDSQRARRRASERAKAQRAAEAKKAKSDSSRGPAVAPLQISNPIKVFLSKRGELWLRGTLHPDGSLVVTSEVRDGETIRMHEKFRSVAASRKKFGYTGYVYHLWKYENDEGTVCPIELLKSKDWDYRGQGGSRATRLTKLETQIERLQQRLRSKVAEADAIRASMAGSR